MRTLGRGILFFLAVLLFLPSVSAQVGDTAAKEIKQMDYSLTTSKNENVGIHGANLVSLKKEGVVMQDEHKRTNTDPVRYDGWSLTLYGRSWHTRSKRNFNEGNWGFGVRKHFGSCFFAYANCYGEWTHVARNSVNGKTESVGAAAWFPVADVGGYQVGVSESLIYIYRYDVPILSRTYKGWVHMPALTFGKNDWRLEWGVLTRDVWKWANGEEKAIYVISYNIRF